MRKLTRRVDALETSASAGVVIVYSHGSQCSLPHALRHAGIVILDEPGGPEALAHAVATGKRIIEIDRKTTTEGAPCVSLQDE